MYIQILITVIGIILLAVYIKEKIKGASLNALILKSLVSCCFLAAALSALLTTWPEGSADTAALCFPVLVIFGLFCGLMGDIWLDLKLVYPADDAPYTYAGFIFFAVGHVFFISGLIKGYGAGIRPWMILAAFAAAVLLGILTVLAGPLLGLNYGRFRTISMIYAPLLISTTLISLVLVLHNGLSVHVPVIMFVGGALFLLSDLVLSGTYFGEGKDRPIDIILNYVFYYGAQFLIAWAAIASCARY